MTNTTNWGGLSIDDTNLPLCPLLWVEDDLPLSDWVGQAFKDDGWTLLVAHDRSGAIDIMEKTIPHHCPCVALLDLGLPPRPSVPDEGLSLLRHLIRDWPLLRATVLTGQNDHAIGQQAVRDGAFDFLVKPTSLREMRRAVQRAAWFSQQAGDLLTQGRMHLSLTAELSEGVKEVSDGVAEQLIRHVLHTTSFNVTAAARMLGLEREQLYYHMKKYGIQRPMNPDVPSPPRS
jgi:DNA-binding NtrC family response regulator